MHILEKYSTDSIELVKTISQKSKFGNRPSFIRCIIMFLVNPIIDDATELALEIIEHINNDAYTHSVLVEELEKEQFSLDCVKMERLGQICAKESETPTKKHENCDKTEIMEKLKRHFVSYNVSLTELEAIAHLLNSKPGTQIPATKYRIVKQFMKGASIGSTKFIYCRRCEQYVCTDHYNSRKVKCMNCDNQIESRNNQSFISISLEEQIVKLLSEYWEDVSSFLEICSSEGSEIRDIYDGTVMRTIRANNKNVVLSCTLSTDGISLQKSSATTVWITQLVCNFLPPRIRYLARNMIAVALYTGPHKPNMFDIHKPLCEELEEIQKSGIVFKNIHFTFRITHAVFDLPAKAQIQNVVQYNGKFGCSYCYHPGVSIEKRIKYPNLKKSPNRRTHRKTLDTMNQIVRKKSVQHIEGEFIMFYIY